jgi:large conductance mechanosensitive channel
MAGVNVADWAARIGVAADGKDIMLKYGVFLQSVIDFVIVAFIIFMALKGINKLKKPAAAAAPPPPPAQEVLLTEIRDLLAKR